METNELLLKITRCPEIVKARGNASHPCAGIVGLQNAETFQAPEPWRGHIETAPILFVSSNPNIDSSIYGKKPFPPPSWSDDQIIDHYRRCFDQDSDVPGPIPEKVYNSVAFWRGVRARAGEILGRRAVPGKCFALTELVHCKSSGQKGVAKAHQTCARRWIDRVMEASGADIVVLVGQHARDHCVARWHLKKSERVHFGVLVGGRERAVVILPHPNARQPRKVRDLVAPEQLQRLRELLADLETDNSERDEIESPRAEAAKKGGVEDDSERRLMVLRISRRSEATYRGL